ncbi:MAG: methyltransferase domain-containing protein [Pyrinomonadaceae bacterium]|nr:methyltransferase domain-containing protein [Pyrinomonadaceae bacterium]
MNISPARLASFEILNRIEVEKAFSSALLPLYEEKLSEKDRGLCHELTLGTLRNQILIDKIIEQYISKKLDREVKISLRMGIYQIRFLDRIPAYSAINESVNLVQKAKKTSAKGLVNAVLRKISQKNVDLNFVDKVEEISIQTSHPRWLIEKWIADFGVEETAKLAKANNETPSLDYRLTAKSINNFENQSLFELAKKGEIYFQDKGSQLVAETIDLQPNEKFLDVCCAPASKLSMIATQNQNQNFFGGDFNFKRLKIAQNSCKKQGLKNVQLVQYDAEKALPFQENCFDKILVDAPCSGTGTIRHNPEIRYFLEQNDFAELSCKQLKILSNASKLLKKGGSLIYSTCSLETEENEQVIASFLEENNDFEIISPKINQKFLLKENFARTFPQRDEMDGFFIAVLKKV